MYDDGYKNIINIDVFLFFFSFFFFLFSFFFFFFIIVVYLNYIGIPTHTILIDNVCHIFFYKMLFNKNLTTLMRI